MIQEKTYITLEYDKILNILKQHLASEVGQEFAQKLRPAAMLKEAETLQEQTWEAESIYTRTGRTPIRPIGRTTSRFNRKTNPITSSYGVAEAPLR